jgi:hypothetical protein
MFTSSINGNPSEVNSLESLQNEKSSQLQGRQVTVHSSKDQSDSSWMIDDLALDPIPVLKYTKSSYFYKEQNRHQRFKKWTTISQISNLEYQLKRASVSEPHLKQPAETKRLYPLLFPFLLYLMCKRLWKRQTKN